VRPVAPHRGDEAQGLNGRFSPPAVSGLTPDRPPRMHCVSAPNEPKPFDFLLGKLAGNALGQPPCDPFNSMPYGKGSSPLLAPEFFAYVSVHRIVFMKIIRIQFSRDCCELEVCRTAVCCTALKVGLPFAWQASFFRRRLKLQCCGRMSSGVQSHYL
jgi:hypothetical protein